jgi:hypothetical protein
VDYGRGFSSNTGEMSINPSNNSTVTSVEGTSEQIPTAYKLEQNYPNPFNPSTTIRYQVPVDGFVTLKIYTLLGQEIATLVNGHQTAGSYALSFDASKLASGIYIYRFNANGFSQTRKMVLMR